MLPTKDDWKKVQGGKPTIESHGRLTVVKHDYPGGDNMIVRSFISIAEMGTVLLEVGSRVVMFPIALLRRFHGDPCEKQSRSAGGDGYDRS